MFPLILITSAAVILLGTLFFWVQRYKRCPSDKVLVVYGKTKGGRSSIAFMAARFRLARHSGLSMARPYADPHDIS